MWLEKLDRIRKIQLESKRVLNDGVTEEELKKFNVESLNRLRYFFPDSYLEALKEVNGLFYNGLNLYAVDEYCLDHPSNDKAEGAIENNLDWYELEENKQYIFLGQDDISWFVMDKTDEKYYTLDLPSGEVMDSFETFDEMFDMMLEISLY